jgi:hypothetical protein
MVLVLDPEKRGCHWQGLRYGAVGSSRHWKRADALNASFHFYDFTEKPWSAAQKVSFKALAPILQRVTDYGNAWLDPETKAPAPHAYRGKGTLKIDFGTFRRYPKFEAVRPHLDTDREGRCLSVAVHVGSGDIDGTHGGALVLHACLDGCEGLSGAELTAAYDAGRVDPERLRTVARVPTRPGRVVFFLSEDVHSVEPSPDVRDVIFTWLKC